MFWINESMIHCSILLLFQKKKKNKKKHVENLEVCLIVSFLLFFTKVEPIHLSLYTFKKQFIQQYLIILFIVAIVQIIQYFIFIFRKTFLILLKKVCFAFRLTLLLFHCTQFWIFCSWVSIFFSNNNNNNN